MEDMDTLSPPSPLIALRPKVYCDESGIELLEPVTIPGRNPLLHRKASQDHV